VRLAHTRDNGRAFEVVHTARRGDRCYMGKEPGYYWHELDEDYAIDEATIRGPYNSDVEAYEAAKENSDGK
jgi:hypothetical protein